MQSRMSGGTVRSNLTFIYERTPGSSNWVFKQKLTDGLAFTTSDVVGNNGLRRMVSVSQDGTLITISGVEGSYGSTNKPAHTLYFYMKNNGAWSLVKKYTPPVPAGHEISDTDLLFGSQVSSKFEHVLSKNGNKVVMRGHSLKTGGNNVDVKTHILIIQKEG